MAVLVVGVLIFVIFVFVIFVGVFIFLVIYVIFVGVFRGGGPPVVRHSSVGRLGLGKTETGTTWWGAGSRFRGSRQKYET